jgi:succinate dehydrogenase / fumarate reductase, membrane anchor subunit
MSSRTAPRVGFSFEYLMWIITRISGLAMFLLSLLGIIGAFVLGARTQVNLSALARWTFFPNPNHVVNTSIPDVAQGWANAWWQVMEILILFFGVTHGLNGLRVVIEDYLGASWSRTLLRGFIFLLWLFFLVVGFYVIQAS